jgi:hypothetical protein
MPSPTPSEQAALDEFRPKRFKDMFKRDREKRQKQEGAWSAYPYGSRAYILLGLNRLIEGFLILLVLVAIITLLIVFNSQIVHGLQPAANWMHRCAGSRPALNKVCWGYAIYSTPGGWLIPIAVLIILSFPPVGCAQTVLLPSLSTTTQLLGHEIVLILVGFTWGLGVGAGIAFAGTLIGEIITF